MTSSSYPTPTSALRVPFFPARSMIRPRPASSSTTSTSTTTASTNQSRRARRTTRRRQGSLSSPAVVVSLPIVDVNNNSSLAVPMAAPATEAGSTSVVLDRVAILKAFAAVSQSSESNSNLSTVSSPANRPSRYEKPTSYREARRRQLRPVSLSDPAIEHELMRLRDSVPSIAGSNASDLTIINEAISLICDLESQLIRKFKCQTLPVLPLSS